MMDFNAKKYQTRGGKPYKLLTTEAAEPYPVVILVKHANGDNVVRLTRDGRVWSNGINNSNDLIEVKPEYTRWLVVLPSIGYSSLEAARECARGVGPDAAVVGVTFREGDGL